MKLDGDKQIYIYGSGQYGRRVFNYLVLSGYGSIVKGFIVSYASERILWNVPIYNYSEIKEKLSDCIVVVAVSSKYINDIKNILSESDAYSIIFIDQKEYTDLEDKIKKICITKPLQRRKVLFSCFHGRGFACNCKYIAEELHRVEESIEIIWETERERDYSFPDYIRKVEIGSFEHSIEWYTSGFIVCNGLSVLAGNRLGQYIINTWHGIGPTKKIGIDINSIISEQDRDNVAETHEPVNLMTAASDLCIRNYREALLYKGEIMKSGYPRNDIFFREDKEELAVSIREKLGVPAEGLMVLYAPTYRYEQRQGAGSLDEMKQRYELPWREVKLALAQRFSKPPRLVYRFHHVTDRGMDVHGRFLDGIDATDYPDMQELLLAADILITDYSSSMWDFSLQRKPVFLFYNDADEVEKEVGFYLHPDKYPYPKGHTSEELCHAIEAFDNEKYQQDLDKWFETYGTYDDGHASERVVERIIDVIDHPEKYGKVE